MKQPPANLPWQHKLTIRNDSINGKLTNVALDDKPLIGVRSIDLHISANEIIVATIAMDVALDVDTQAEVKDAETIEGVPIHPVSLSDELPG
jgi:hypothetical protein